jgi:hypothetical protein
MTRIARTALIAMLGCLLTLSAARGEGRTTKVRTLPAPERASWELASDEEGTFWQRMTSGTRGFFSRTKTVMTPAPKPMKANYRSRLSGFSLSNLFGSKERDAPATMDEWMRLKRPEAP